MAVVLGISGLANGSVPSMSALLAAISTAVIHTPRAVLLAFATISLNPYPLPLHPL